MKEAWNELWTGKDGRVFLMTLLSLVSIVVGILILLNGHKDPVKISSLKQKFEKTIRDDR